MYRFQQRLKFINQKIKKKWNKQSFGNIFQEKLSLESQMEKVQQSIISQGDTSQLKEQESNLLHQLQK